MRQYIFILILLFAFANDGLSQVEKVGVEVFKQYDSPHPYSGNINNTKTIIWREVIKVEEGSYVAVHFSKMELSRGDYLLVQSSDGSRSWKYTGKGNTLKENPGEGFWSIPIYDTELIIEIHSFNQNGSFGYSIDKIARGFTWEEYVSNRDEALCGQDDTQNARCYAASLPTVYDKSRAVARLMMNGTGACTGWLIGNEGNLMTNEHCVESVNTANNTTVEFMAEGSNCNSECSSWFACAGTIEASTTTLVQLDAPLDYALLQLPTNVSATYGYLQLRETGAVLNERIYIPQHPQAWGKRISVNSDNQNDVNGFSSIFSLTRPRCGGTGNDIGYFADTQGGSSGSPVIGFGDNLVVALHHCANCPNRGVPIQEIINDLGANLPNNAIGGNCIPNLAVTTNYNNGSNIDLEVSNTITASNDINSGANVVYDAGLKVRLIPGFHAKSGSTFRAFIDGCGGAMPDGQHNTELDKEEAIFADKQNSSLDQSFTLNTFPNPFSDQTTIEYNLPEDSEVTLVLSSLTGETVKIIEQKIQKVAGKHNITLDGSNMSNGIYYLTLYTGAALKTQKLILSR